MHCAVSSVYFLRSDRKLCAMGDPDGLRSMVEGRAGAGAWGEEVGGRLGRGGAWRHILDRVDRWRHIETVYWAFQLHFL